jgi:serine/threonine protein kinase
MNRSGGGKYKKYRNSLISFDEALKEIQNQSCEVRSEEIVLGRKLGEGSMAEVYEATFRGQKCAAKRLKQGVKEGTVQYNDLLLEVHTLASIGNHPNIVTFYGACIQEKCSPGGSANR